MASLNTLRRTILMSLERHRALLENVHIHELATGLGDDIARFIAIEATLEAFADVPAPTEEADLETPADGGFGGRHVGRPNETVEDLRFRSEIVLAALEYSETHLKRRLDHGEPLPFNARVDELIRERIDRIMVGARYLGRPGKTVGRPRQTVTDTVGLPWPPHWDQPFFPFASGRPGGDHWLMENGYERR